MEILHCFDSRRQRQEQATGMMLVHSCRMLLFY